MLDYDDESDDSPSLEGKYSDYGSTQRASRASPRGAQGPSSIRGVTQYDGRAGEGLVRSNVARSAVLSKSITVTGDVCYPTSNCCQTCSVKQTGKGARFRARSESLRKSRRAGRSKTIMESGADNRRQDVASESFSHHKRWLAGFSNFALGAIILHEMKATQLMETEHSLLYPVRT